MRALLALALLVPLADAALLVQSGSSPMGLDAPHVPQAYCHVVQTAAQVRCDAYDLPVRSAQLLRLRIEGEGHAIAYADFHLTGSTCDAGPCQQLPPDAPLDCAAQVYAMCSYAVSPLGLRGVVDLHLLADGPGRATYSLWMERVLVSLP